MEGGVVDVGGVVVRSHELVRLPKPDAVQPGAHHVLAHPAAGGEFAELV